MEPLLWSILLFVAALGLIALEIFIPSGGVLGILAALALIASLAVAFSGGTMTGVTMLLVTIIVVPAMLALAVRWWPHTPIGRLIVLQTPESEDEVLPDTPEYRGLGSLVGKRGVAKTKMPESDVAGKATVFVFPDLNTGNNTYKAVQRSAGAVAVGPVLQGLKYPVNDLSRGCTVADIVNTVAITAIQAQSENE